MSIFKRDSWLRKGKDGIDTGTAAVEGPFEQDKAGQVNQAEEDKDRIKKLGEKGQ